jgi:hypothetical protein
MASKQHSEIGASIAHRWMNCPGSVNLCRGIPSKETKYALEGTRAHEIVEIVANGKQEVWELDCDQEMKDAALLYITYIRGLKKPGPDGRFWIEKEFYLKNYDERAYGTADAVIVNPDEIYVIDFKYGAGYAVEVKDNPQLKFYALGVYFLLPEAAKSRIKTAKMGIIQPRAPHDDGPIRIAEISIRDLVEWGDTILKPAMGATRQDNALLKTGDWCKWCPAISQCPEQKKLVVGGVIVDFAEEFLPTKSHISNDDVSKILDNEERIRSWLDSIRDTAKDRLNDGVAIKGYKLTNGRTSKVWANEAEALKALIEELGEAAYKKTLLSPAQAIKAKFKRMDLIAEVVGQPLLVKESSNRKQYVKASSCKDFQKEEDQW